MCGIGAFVNLRKNKQLARPDFEILTNLLVELESRGRHATGFAYYTKKDNICTMNIHKVDLPAHKFVDTDEWNNVIDKDVNGMVLHTRFLTIGKAEHIPNNHPFVSQDNRFSMVHNGCIDKSEILKAFGLKESNNIETDSYAFMQAFESVYGDGSDLSVKDSLLKVLTNMYTTGNGYAIYFMDTHKDMLYYFRNNSRPTKIFRHDECIFFSSDTEYMQNAINDLYGTDEIKIELESENTTIETLYELDMLTGEVESTSYDHKVKKTYTKTTNYNYYKNKSSYSYGYGNSGYDDYEDFDWDSINKETKKVEDCEHCKGSGFLTLPDQKKQQCPACCGEGIKSETIPCLKCAGFGYDNDKLCESCYGLGIVWDEDKDVKNIEYQTKVNKG